MELQERVVEGCSCFLFRKCIDCGVVGNVGPGIIAGPAKSEMTWWVVITCDSLTCLSWAPISQAVIEFLARMSCAPQGGNGFTRFIAQQVGFKKDWFAEHRRSWQACLALLPVTGNVKFRFVLRASRRPGIALEALTSNHLTTATVLSYLVKSCPGLRRIFRCRWLRWLWWR